ncbi:uncharacterized protein IL334_006584 [Kwoniella shivajii]|uniref:Ig-like domain-containing protein n=1 Tax=Kwoniella shivajii TaxID=564305 RepID=A0ABZ1D6C3_9TREE|nr:hypothetical protein IL334_006584 [Kwoniella shivajii]
MAYVQHNGEDNFQIGQSDNREVRNTITDSQFPSHYVSSHWPFQQSTDAMSQNSWSLASEQSSFSTSQPSKDFVPNRSGHTLGVHQAQIPEIGQHNYQIYPSTSINAEVSQSSTPSIDPLKPLGPPPMTDEEADMIIMALSSQNSPPFFQARGHAISPRDPSWMNSRLKMCFPANRNAPNPVRNFAHEYPQFEPSSSSTVDQINFDDPRHPGLSQNLSMSCSKIWGYEDQFLSAQADRHQEAPALTTNLPAGAPSTTEKCLSMRQQHGQYSMSSRSSLCDSDTNSFRAGPADHSSLQHDIKTPTDNRSYWHRLDDSGVNATHGTTMLSSRRPSRNYTDHENQKASLPTMATQKKILKLKRQKMGCSRNYFRTLRQNRFKSICLTVPKEGSKTDMGQTDELIISQEDINYFFDGELANCIDKEKVVASEFEEESGKTFTKLQSKYSMNQAQPQSTQEDTLSPSPKNYLMGRFDQGKRRLTWISATEPTEEGSIRPLDLDQCFLYRCLKVPLSTMKERPLTQARETRQEKRTKDDKDTLRTYAASRYERVSNNVFCGSLVTDRDYRGYRCTRHGDNFRASRNEQGKARKNNR